MAKKEKKHRKPRLYLTCNDDAIQLWEGGPPKWSTTAMEGGCFVKHERPAPGRWELQEFGESSFARLTGLKMKHREIISVPRKRFKDLFKGLKAHRAKDF